MSTNTLALIAKFSGYVLEPPSRITTGLPVVGVRLLAKVIEEDNVSRGKVKLNPLLSSSPVSEMNTSLAHSGIKKLLMQHSSM